MIQFSDNYVIASSGGEYQPDLPGMEVEYDSDDPIQIAEDMIDSGVPIDVVHERLLSMDFDVNLVDLGERLGKFIVHGDKLINSDGWGDEINDFLWGLNDLDLGIYMEENGLIRDEWQDVGVAYHATPMENADKIEREGIVMMNKSRGISNKFTPPAVFMSENIDEMGTYGDALFEIDLDAMKRDGNTPMLQREEPVSESEARMSIASRLGVEDPHSYGGETWDGMAEDTLVLFGDVPAKYIKRIK